RTASRNRGLRHQSNSLRQSQHAPSLILRTGIGILNFASTSRMTVESVQVFHCFAPKLRVRSRTNGLLHERQRALRPSRGSLGAQRIGYSNGHLHLSATSSVARIRSPLTTSWRRGTGARFATAGVL